MRDIQDTDWLGFVRITRSIPAMQADMKFAMRAGGHGLQSQPRQVGFAVGRQCADAADLDGDRAEVGEPAKRVGGDRKGPRIELRLERPELQKRHEFVQHQARAQQVADGRRILPGHAHQPRHRGEDHAEDLLQRAGSQPRSGHDGPSPECH